MKHNEELNKTIDAVFSEHAPLTAKQRVTVRELLLDAIEDAGFYIGANGENHPATADKPMPPGYGVRVVFEGLQASGKTLLSNYVARLLHENGVTHLREVDSDDILVKVATVSVPRTGEDIVGNDTRPTILRPASNDYNKAADAVTGVED